jgi:hypothetical protein
VYACTHEKMEKMRHTLARISFEEMGVACFALGIVATGFFVSAALSFFPTLTFTSAFLSVFAMARNRSEGRRRTWLSRKIWRGTLHYVIQLPITGSGPPASQASRMR